MSQALLTQYSTGITLNAANYVILILLSTLASIGTTPIPSASLVLIVMICGSVDVPITGMYSSVSFHSLCTFTISRLT